MKLLTETVHDVQFLKEDVGNGKKKYYIKGIFLQGNIKNQNGRIYPIEVLQKEVDKFNKDYVLQNRAIGELGHAESPTVNFDKASHLIKSIKQNGNDFIGTAKILDDTPMGKITKALMDEGVKLAVSSRALGSLKEQAGPEGPIKIVQPDFMLATVDIVHNPSAPEAFVENNIINENVEWLLDSKTKKWIPQYVKGAKRILANKGRKDKNVIMAKLYEDFIRKL